MQWVFDKFVGWILEKLSGCFDVMSGALFTFFNMDRSTFDSFFGFFGTPGKSMPCSLFDAFRYLAYALCVLLVCVRLMQNFFALVTEDYEDPVKAAARAVLSFVAVTVSARIVNIEFMFLNKPYNGIKSMLGKEQKTLGGMGKKLWKNLADSLTDGFNDAGAGDKVVMDIIIIGCLFAIFFGFLKLVLEVAERYVVICISLYLSPLVFATVASKNTSKILGSYLRMVFCQLLLMIFNVVFVYGTVIGIYNYVASGAKVDTGSGSVTCPAFIFCVLILAFITAGQKMDTYMRSIGLDTVQTGSLFDEIRGATLNCMMLGRSIGGMARSAGGIGRAVTGAVSNAASTVSGHRGTTANGAGNSAREGTVAGAAAEAGRTAAANVSQRMAQGGNSRLQSVAQRAAQSQIRSGAFNGVSGDSNRSLGKAVETAIGAANMAKMGIDAASLSGKAGMVNFTSGNGAKGTLAFEPKEGNGWKQLKDESGNTVNAWVKGSSSIGIRTDAKAGTHGTLAETIGAGAAEAISGFTGNRVRDGSIRAVSLGNGHFSLFGEGADGQNVRLGRIVPAETAAGVSGAQLAENEFGGTAGFIPSVDTEGLLSGTDLDCGYVSLGDNMNVPVDAVNDALGSMLEANNIPEGTALLGFESDGENFTASFADPVSGTREITGSCGDLAGAVDPADILPDDDSRVGQSSWLGMNDLFDTHAYSAVTNETPKSIEAMENGRGWVVTNEDGSRMMLEQAADTGKTARVISGGDIIRNVPLSVRNEPKSESKSEPKNNVKDRRNSPEGWKKG